MLVTEYLSGNTNALAKLVKRWHKLFCEKAYWMVKDGDMAKDIAQDSWNTIIDKIGSLEDPSSFGGWALRIVYTKSLNCIKSVNRKRHHLELYRYEQDEVSVENDDDDMLKKTLLNAITTLPEQQQIVIRLFYKEAYSLKDISAILSISVGTAKSRLFHAREKLKSILKHRIELG